MLLQELQAIFDPTFSAHSYGFRPGRSAHEAVRAAQTYARAGKNWVVDMDITQFFDHVNHDILMQRIGQTIRDKRVLRLIGRYLRAGVMIQGVVQRTGEGTPQGGPLSPLLANLYLDALDRETPAAGSQREQERRRATLGTEVPWVHDQPEGTDRSSPQERGTVRAKSPGVMAELPESEQ